MKKLAIIGASYLQAPLIKKAKELGIETHVFAWAANDIGEGIADHFYPISIVERDRILEKCRALQIDGICSVASDLAMLTVNYVASKLGFTANSMACTHASTNKHLMRERFKLHGDPSPASYMINDVEEAKRLPLDYPVIVKPLDRSGSRGITKVSDPSDLSPAIEKARSVGFDKHVLVEEFAEGVEYSVEYISWKGEHHFLALTQKYTTGEPFFIETGHVQPAPVSEILLSKIKEVVAHALTSLGIEYGASHSELKIDTVGNIRIIEIGGRMGGDFIGSHLVPLSTGYDFLKGVIDVALGQKPEWVCQPHYPIAAVRFVLNTGDYTQLSNFKKTGSVHIIQSDLKDLVGAEVTDSGTRWGYLLATFDRYADAVAFMNM